MTRISNEEAIKRLNEARFTIQPYFYMNEAIDMGIEYIKRQIAQPVEKDEVTYGTPYLCPECAAEQCRVHFITADGSKAKKQVSYCWQCGQAIDWSEEE